VDDVNLLASEVQRLAIKYSGIPHIYSGCKPKKSLCLISDTREQLPIFKGAECKRIGLMVGDYTTEKLHNKFHVERKSLQDLYGSIIQGHKRFSDELVKSIAYEIKLAIFVEGTKKQFENKAFPRGKDRNIKGETLVKIINSIERRYKIEVVWCTSRRNLKKCIIERFKKEETKLR
jgi:ERCC4-type nuclease